VGLQGKFRKNCPVFQGGLFMIEFLRIENPRISISYLFEPGQQTLLPQLNSWLTQLN
jgi:hypothetical protein